MKNYDAIVGFDYIEIKEWKDFIKDQIVPLQKSILKFLKIRKCLKSLSKEKSLSLLKDNQVFRQILLGGIDKDGNYSFNSIAKLYRDTIGISIDPKEWVLLSKQKGINASEYIEISNNNQNKPDFLKFIKELKEIIVNILKKYDLNIIEQSNDDTELTFKNSENILEELFALYSLTKGLTANYNYKTFFILTTRLIPIFYLKLVYPKLKENFEELAGFLGLEQMIEIKIDNSTQNYEIWGHRKEGLADLVYKLNKTIWDYYGKKQSIYLHEEWINDFILNSSLGKVGEIVNLKHKFFSTVQSSLLNLKISKNIRTINKIPYELIQLFECIGCNKLFSDPERYESNWEDPLIYDLKFDLLNNSIKNIVHGLNYRRKFGSSASTRSKTTRRHEDGLNLKELIKNLCPLMFLDFIELTNDEHQIIVNYKD